MAYTRIYENIYTFPVLTNGVVNSENVKIFFAPCPQIRNRKIVAMSLSYLPSIAGQQDQLYLTLKNGKGDVLMYNYPATDLQDSTNTPNPTLFINYRLRLFNYYDIDLANSYFFFSDISGPLGANNQPIFNINFYLE